MEHTDHSVRAVFEPALEFALAFLTVVALVFPTAALVDGVLGDPIGAVGVPLTAAVGVVASYPFVTGRWSLRRLARSLGITVVTMPFWLLVAGSALSLLHVAMPAGGRGPFLFAWLLGLATAYVRVYADRVEFPSLGAGAGSPESSV